MGQSLSQLYVHLVFSTNGRQEIIPDETGPLLHGYMSGIFKQMDSPAIEINSVPDHIHTLFRLSKNYALAKVVETVKKESSRWMKTKGERKFSWQKGYGAFSVSGAKVEIVRNYIIRQKEHHIKMTLRQEIEGFVREYDVIEYDPQYFWD